MKTLHVTVANRAATYSRREGDIVCGNNDYEIKFLFDAEWDDITEKTAHFKWNGQHFDVEFTGDTCPVPIITNAHLVKVGIFVDGVRATTDATIGCIPSTLCGSTTPNPGTGQNYTNEAKAAAEEAKGYAEEAQAAAEDGKAIIVTVDGTTPSHTNAEIYEAVTNGKAVYLAASDGTYVLCTKCTPTIARFEQVNTYDFTIDGTRHYGRQLYTYLIQNDVYKTTQAIVPSKSYVDAMVEASGLECVGSVTVTPSIGQENFYLGNDQSWNKTGGYMGAYALDSIARCDLIIVNLTIARDSYERFNLIFSGGQGYQSYAENSIISGGSEGVYIPSVLADLIFGEPSYNDQGHLQCEVLCSSVTFTGYNLPRA